MVERNGWKAGLAIDNLDLELDLSEVVDTL